MTILLNEHGQSMMKWSCLSRTTSISNWAPNIDADYAHESLFQYSRKYRNIRSPIRNFCCCSFYQDDFKTTISKRTSVTYQEQLVHLEDDSIIELGRVWLKSNSCRKFYFATSYGTNQNPVNRALRIRLQTFWSDSTQNEQSANN